MLKDKWALVTGASAGLGEAVAVSLAAVGANVVLHDLVEPKETRDRLQARTGVDAMSIGADLSQRAAIETMMAELLGRLGAIDILVNNAGIQFVSPVEEFPEAKWEAIIAINLSAVFYGMKAAIPGMKAKKWGRIINIASAHGLVASPHKVAYVAAKHGVVGATKVAAIELANEGVTVNAICPGWVLTPLVQHQLEDRAIQAGTDVPTEMKKMLQETQPMLKFSTPEEIGALTVFLCSDGAATITGVPLPIDGGWVAH